MKKLLLLVSMFICIIGFSQAPKPADQKAQYEAQEEAHARKVADRDEAEVKLRKYKQKSLNEDREKIEGYSPVNQPNMQQQQQGQ